MIKIQALLLNIINVELNFWVMKFAVTFIHVAKDSKLFQVACCF